MTRIPPLLAEEQNFKRLYLSHPDAHLEEAHTVREISVLCPESVEFLDHTTPYQPSDSLRESRFPQYLDLTVMPHRRYSPAFWHSHTFFEIICVLNGSCANIFTSHTLTMTEGDVCIVAPTTTHALSSFADDSIVCNLMVKSSTFRAAFLNSLPQQGALYSFFSHALYQPGSESYLYFDKPKDPGLQALVLQMLKEYEKQDSYYGSLLNALLTTFFIGLLRKYEKNILVSNPSGRKQEENIIFLLRYIEQHTDISLSQLASFFNYSERQISRLLKEYTGKTFTQLLQEVRLSRACELLQRSDIPIHTIIESVGYSNESYFYCLFEKQYGISPAQYRKEHLSPSQTILPPENPRDLPL